MTDWAIIDEPSDPVRRLAAKRIRVLLHEGVNSTLVGVAVGLAWLAFLGFGVVFRPLRSSASLFAFALLVIATAAIVTAVIRRRRFRVRSAQIARIADELGVCACCGYDLHGLPAASDHSRACPECGATWAASGADARDPLEPEPVRHPSEEYAHGMFRTWRHILESLLDRRSVGHIKDDRGDRVAIVGLGFEAGGTGFELESDQIANERIRRAIRPVGRLTRIFTVGLLVTPAVFMTPAIFRSIRAGTLSLTIPAILGAMIMFIVLPYLILRGNFGYRPRSIRGRLLRIGVCPSCAASLAPACADDDGCRQCPSCGAAWSDYRIDHARMLEQQRTEPAS